MGVLRVVRRRLNAILKETTAMVIFARSRFDWRMSKSGAISVSPSSSLLYRRSAAHDRIGKTTAKNVAASAARKQASGVASEERMKATDTSAATRGAAVFLYAFPRARRSAADPTPVRSDPATNAACNAVVVVFVSDASRVPKTMAAAPAAEREPRAMFSQASFEAEAKNEKRNGQGEARAVVQ